jgi:hypothetical protein
LSRARIDDAEAFVLSPNGTETFGLLTAEVAGAGRVRPGEIKLQRGLPSAAGFGLRHVETNEGRIKSIRHLGYAGFVAFASDVARNYDRVCSGSGGKLILVLDRNGYDHCLVIRDNVSFWGIVTGLPKRRERATVLWRRTREGGSEPPPASAGKRPRFEKLTLPKPRS